MPGLHKPHQPATSPSPRPTPPCRPAATWCSAEEGRGDEPSPAISDGCSGSDVQLVPPKPNLVPLQGVRGLACLWIFLGHALLYFTPQADPYFIDRLVDGQPPPALFVDGGSAAPPAPPLFLGGARYPVFGLENHSTVTLFFLISGFTFTVGYNRDSREGDDPCEEPLSTPNARMEFYRKRIARLFPLYVLSLLLSAVPFVLFTAPRVLGTGNLLEFILSAITAPLLLQSVVTWKCTMWNGVLWSVSAFCICYCCFPPLLRRLRRLCPPKLACLVHFILPTMCIAIGVFFIAFSKLRFVYVLHFFVGFRMVQFSLGIASGLHFQRVKQPPSRLRLELLSVIFLLNQAACILLTAWAPPLQAAYWWSMYSFLAEWVLTGVYAAWIRALAHPACAGSFTARLLSSTPLSKLGQLSYAVYTLHFPVLNWVALIVQGLPQARMFNPGFEKNNIRKESPNNFGWFIFPAWALPLLFILVILVAALFHAFLERPARTALNRGSSARTSGIGIGIAAGFPSGTSATLQRSESAGSLQGGDSPV